jgi:hypothetical protein
MAFTVVYDACVLYPAPLRDLLIRIANTGLVRARWTDRILDECFGAILAQRPDLKREALARTRELMTQAVPDCLVRGYEPLIEGIELPDPDDRHVVAAAVRCGAQVIVTFNLDDFPSERLGRYNLEAQHPDDFLLDSIDLSPGMVVRVIEDQLAALRNPPIELARLLDALRRLGLVQSVARLRELLY